MFPQTVWPHTGVLTVTVKARCSIEVVSVAFGIFPVNFHTKWLLWNVRVHFDCEGSHIIIIIIIVIVIVIVIVTVILILIIIIMIIIIISIIIIKGGSAMPDALNCHRRKFRSQTSDNMDRWKAEMGRVREEKRREQKRTKKEYQKRESLRRKKIQVREKVGKSRNTVFFQWFVAPKGRKVGSLKRRVRSHLARWEMKNCTPLWREAHFQVKVYKTPRLRITFGSWDVEKVHTVVARSTFRSQNVQKTPRSEHFWKLRCWKSARRCGAKHISKSKCTKHTILGPLLEGSDVILRGRCKGFCSLSKTRGFCSSSKNDGRRGTFEEDLQRCMSRGRRRTRDMFIRDVKRSGRWFPERGCILEHHLQFCFFFAWQVQYDLASIFRRQVEWKNRKTHWYEAVSSALNFPFLKEVSQNCFVLDVAKFKNWGSLAELLRFQA